MANLTLAQMLARLLDNNNGDISAQDVQDVITALAERTDGTNPLAGILFNTTATAPPHTTGHVHWNDDDNTLEVDSEIAGVKLQIGQEQWISARNASGSTIPNGTAVQQVGVTGNRPNVAPDDGMGDIIGIVTHDMPNNTDGKVTSFGLVREVNTSAFAAGDTLYVDTAGAYTTSVTPSLAGFVLRSHSTQGTILSRPDRRSVESGTTAERPVASFIGFSFFDTSLGFPVFWDGTDWVDATGSVV